MNKNATPIILLILAIGIYFTFTKGKLDELNVQKNINAGYQEAINNSEKLIKMRDNLVKAYNEISDDDKDRLEKMVPNNIDNVRLTLDVKSIGIGRGLILKNVKTNAPNINTAIAGQGNKVNSNASQSTINTGAVTKSGKVSLNNSYDTVTLSFNITTDYQTFLALLKDIETSLRIIDISKISITANDTNLYDYNVELKTYWLKQ